MPPDAASDRVAAQLGPGNPRDVIASLLQGSRFDYIVLGSVNDPNLRVAGGADAPHSFSNVTGRRRPDDGIAERRSATKSRDSSAAPRLRISMPRKMNPSRCHSPKPVPVPAAVNPQVQPGVYQPGMPGAMVPPPGPENPQLAPGQQNPQAPGQTIRTPEQLLQELQRMQQQQQQQPRQPQQQQD